MNELQALANRLAAMAGGSGPADMVRLENRKGRRVNSWRLASTHKKKPLPADEDYWRDLGASWCKWALTWTSRGARRPRRHSTTLPVSACRTCIDLRVSMDWMHAEGSLAYDRLLAAGRWSRPRSARRHRSAATCRDKEYQDARATWERNRLEVESPIIPRQQPARTHGQVLEALAGRVQQYCGAPPRTYARTGNGGASGPARRQAQASSISSPTRRPLKTIDRAIKECTGRRGSDGGTVWTCTTAG